MRPAANRLPLPAGKNRHIRRVHGNESNREWSLNKRCRTLQRVSQMRWRTTLAATGVIAMAAVWAWARPGAAAQQDSSGTTTLQVYSRMTVVDVTATDADGQPVYGLKQSDFTIFEDGKPQPRSEE